MKKKTNIVLVHGAWGEGSNWQYVIPLLHEQGFNVRAVQIPLTTLAEDVSMTKNLLSTLDGPTLLVGHSYGGVVISEAGNDPKVVGLVYIAAFVPDEGESVTQLYAINPPPPGATIARPDEAGFLWLEMDKFHENFCQDLSKEEALIMAACQKPLAAKIFDQPAGTPAWKIKPSWYQISSLDRMIPPETEKMFAYKINAKKTITVEAGHASMASRPNEIATLIMEAANSFE